MRIIWSRAYEEERAKIGEYVGELEENTVRMEMQPRIRGWRTGTDPEVPFTQCTLGTFRGGEKMRDNEMLRQMSVTAPAPTHLSSRVLTRYDALSSAGVITRPPPPPPNFSFSTGPWAVMVPAKGMGWPPSLPPLTPIPVPYRPH